MTDLSTDYAHVVTTTYHTHESEQRDHSRVVFDHGWMMVDIIEDDSAAPTNQRTVTLGAKHALGLLDILRHEEPRLREWAGADETEKKTAT